MFLKMKKAKFHYILKSIFTSFAYVKWLSEVTQSNKLKHSKNNYLSSSAVCVMSSFEKLLQKLLLTKCLKKVVFLKTLYKHFQKKCLILLCNMLIDASLLHLFSTFESCINNIEHRVQIKNQFAFLQKEILVFIHCFKSSIYYLLQ